MAKNQRKPRRKIATTHPAKTPKGFLNPKPYISKESVGHPGRVYTPLLSVPITMRGQKKIIFYSLWTKQTLCYNSAMPLGRDYAMEYRRYHSSPRAKKDRASRNAARRKAMAAGKVKKGDGKDIDHKDGNPRNNRPANLRAMSRGLNRGRDNNSWRR